MFLLLDGVAFIDPRSSEIDIIQSVGRAIRLSENKTMGTIVIPIFIEQTDTDDGHRLGKWVSVQRRTKDTMEPVRRQRLEALPGRIWKVEK